MDVSIHPTALIDDGVIIGVGTSVADSVRIHGPATVGRDCLIGEKSNIAGAVDIADRVEVGPFAHVCAGVTIGSDTLIGPGVVFTNQRYPRAGRPLGADGRLRPTTVHDGVTIGARAVVGCDIEIGRYALIGMGAVVTRAVSDHHLVIGNPARTAGFVCRCGTPLLRFDDVFPILHIDLICLSCDRRYAVRDGLVTPRLAASNIIPFGRQR